MRVSDKKRTHNSTYKKLAVQWFNEVLCSETRPNAKPKNVIQHAKKTQSKIKTRES